MTEEQSAIRTRPYVLEEGAVMSIIRRQLLRRFLITTGLVVVIIIAVVMGRDNSTPIERSICATSLIMLLFARQLYGLSSGIIRYRDSLTEAGWFSVPRQNEIDDRFFVTTQQSSEFSKSAMDGLFKEARLQNNYYVLKYVPGNLMTFIPANAFESPDDQRHFEALLAQKGVKITRKKG